MIVKIGVRTLTKDLVAYREIGAGESEAEAFARLNAEVQEKGATPKDPTMIVFYDPKEKEKCRREAMVIVDRDVPGLRTKTLPEVRAGFIVFAGTSHPPEYYYEELRKHLKERGLNPAVSPFCSVEATYQPDNFNLSSGSLIDEDSQDTWTTEIILPVEG